MSGYRQISQGSGIRDNTNLIGSLEAIAEYVVSALRE